MITTKDAEEILKHEYHRDNFEYIASEILLPDYKRDIHDVAFKNTLFSNVTWLGNSTQCDITVMEVALSSGAENRRVAITQEMFKILKGLRINNALVAFYNADKNNYRLSLLTSKYEYDGDTLIKVVSNPRRYSYSLGFGTKTKTAYKFLISKGKVNSLDELTARFSVEVVNKEFYSQVATCFTQLVGGDREGKTHTRLLSLHGVINQNKFAEFSVRLIGRIMFCWFLREKKSEQGIPLVPDEMVSLSSTDENTSYYHNVLEPLFFELLNTNQNRRKDKFGNEDIYKQVPHLNGGLFSPHFDDLYRYTSTTQSGIYGVVSIPNSWFVNFYNVLSQYNFTVDENTSYDIELSIDPEMLGRIFENLLAEINPETGENAKKSTGSFYTPRDIVDYMVDSSILEYLKEKTSIDETKLKALISYGSEDDMLASLDGKEKKAIINALYTVTVLDPACGSGAFPIGMLQKIVYILQEIDPDANMWFDKATESVGILLKREFEKKFNAGSLNYIRKLSVIQNSIFGVDIQPIAVEIARLRCFLSLVIEEKVCDTESNRGINPLPNLDFKFVIANSLVELENSAQSSMFENQEHITELKAVRDEFFGVDDAARKAELKLEFAHIQKKMFQETISLYNKIASARYQSLSDWSPFENKATAWFDPEWMFGIKDGFDIVIGNPPYFVYQKEHVDEITTIKKQKFASIIGSGKINAYRAFIAKSITSLLRKNGILSMIFQNSFLGDSSAGKLREHIFNNHSIICLDAFPERDNIAKRVFEGVKMSVCILLMKEGASLSAFQLNKYNDKKFEMDYSSTLRYQDIKKIDEKNYTIPMIKPEEMSILITAFNNKAIQIKAIEGEINMTFHKHLLSENEEFPETLKGAAIQRFRITKKMSQGKREFLNVSMYERENSGEKTKHFQSDRIVMQGITGVDDRRRLIMSIVPKNFYLANSCNYILKPNGVALEYILGIMNSRLMNWIFKKTSTNSNVNCYEINNLPILAANEATSDELCSLVIKIVSSKISDSSVDTTGLENEIDKLVYELYGLTEEEIAIVEGN